MQTFAQDHRVFVTDWKNTRDVAVSEGEFHLDDYVDYLLDFIRTIDGPVHVIAVCQPSVPVLMSAAVQAMRGEKKQLSSITLMGGPIDTRLSPPRSISMLPKSVWTGSKKMSSLRFLWVTRVWSACLPRISATVRLHGDEFE